jgi:hypothetical protein
MCTFRLEASRSLAPLHRFQAPAVEGDYRDGPITWGRRSFAKPEAAMSCR